MAKTYKEKKELAIAKAVEFQSTFAEHNYSYAELADMSEKFTRLTRRYGLVREFRENGII